MSIGAFIISVSVLFAILFQAVNFSRLTACRQEGWLKSTELITTKKMANSENVSLYHPKCKIRVSGDQKVFWQKINSGQVHHFHLRLSGNL